ncbi:MAG TPA: hypothetical protein ENK06_13555 [Gammaproteobacteria bacterium]|nr:hypothetical protein [Gammaproteobacteria bacterium]
MFVTVKKVASEFPHSLLKLGTKLSEQIPIGLDYFLAIINTDVRNRSPHHAYDPIQSTTVNS